MISRCAPAPRFIPPAPPDEPPPKSNLSGGNISGGGGNFAGGGTSVIFGGIYGGFSLTTGCVILGGGTVVIPFVGLIYDVILSGGLSYPVIFFPGGLVNSDTPLGVGLGVIAPPDLTNETISDIPREVDNARLSPFALAIPIVSERALDIALDSLEGTDNAPPLETSLNTDIPSYAGLKFVRDFSEALLLAAATAPAVDSDSTKDFPS